MKASKLAKTLVLLCAALLLTVVVPTNDNTANAAKKTTIKINSGKSKKMVVKQSVTLKVTGTRKVTWYISSKNNRVTNTKVAKISNKKNRTVRVRARKTGKCYVLAKVGNQFYSCRITVSEASKTTKKNSYTDYELYLMSHLINAEAGSSWISDEEQRAVGSVVLNRVKDRRFPNTMQKVIYQRGQYSCTWNGSFSKKPSARVIKNAKHVLRNGSTIPKKVVFQAQFFQGKGVWKVLGNHYFCY